MAVQELQVNGYRSLHNVRLRLQRLNVVTGPNGSGKSNLYRALWLIAKICEGQFGHSICREGGLLSAMWAGPRESNKKPVRMSLSFRVDDLTYLMTCGYPPTPGTMFCWDPEIKEEAIWHGVQRKPSMVLLERAAGITRIRETEGGFVEYPLMLDSNESVLSQLREPHRFPELFALREEVRGWRFYHTFRTDDEAPLRRPRISVRTPVLSHDGSDLAAALQTILEIGDGHTLKSIVSSALPGRQIEILTNQPDDERKSPRNMELFVGLATEGCTRTLLAHELSDGTRKFLCLAAALLSPRPPSLIALNEPEASLHPDLLAPLAKLIVQASRFSQVWVSTHSQILVDCIQAISGVLPICLVLSNGETIVEPADEAADG